MANFANTFFPTSFGIFDKEIEFQKDADSMVTFVKRSLGDNVLSVELPSKTIWDCFEQSSLQWSSIINEFQVKGNLSSILGAEISGSISGKYPRETLDFLMRQAQAYADVSTHGGKIDHVSGSIDLEAGRQDYDIFTELKNADGVPLVDLSGSYGGGIMRVNEIHHYSPAQAYRFFGTTSATNYLANEFAFDSFTPDTMFYMLPVHEDLMRMGQLQLSQRVRRSNYYYRLIGRNLRIFPIPRERRNPRKLFIRVSFGSGNPFSDTIGGPNGQPDPSVNGVSSLSDAPYDVIPYNQIQSVGKQWIRDYCLALCMIRLGWIRGKYDKIPVPNESVILNYQELLQRGYDEKQRLEDRIREQLDSMTQDKLVEQQANKAENLNKQLKFIPSNMFIYVG